jgi:tetratricopeptide (TPR) repeat protein
MNLKFKRFFTIFLLLIQINPIQAATNTDSLNLLLNTIKSPEKKVDLIIEYLDKSENQYIIQADYLAERAYNISVKSNYTIGKINSLLFLGHYFFKKNDFKKAMEYAQKSKDLSDDNDDTEGYARSLNLIGSIYSEFGDYDNSSYYFFQGLKLFDKLKDNRGIARSYGDIGLDFYQQHYYKKALEYYNKAFIVAEKIGDQSIIKKQYNNIAVVYGDLGRYDTAIIFLKKALAISIRLKDKLGQGINIMNIGYIQMNSGNYSEALNNFQQSLDLLTELHNLQHMAECNLNMGYCYFSIDKIDNSIVYFKKALELGQSQEYYTVLYNASKMLHQIYSSRSDFNNSYNYALLELHSLDSLYSSQKQDLITKHEVQYVYDKKEFERKLAQSAKDKVMMIVILSLIFGLIIVTLFLSRFRLRAKYITLEKEKVESELSIKNRELTVNLLSLIKKNELLSGLSTRLIQFENQAKSLEARELMSEINREIRNSTDDKMLNEFSLRFQEVHAGFYESLLKFSPDLTQNELKLCAFLRLNMSTKDISELTGQQLTAIDQARYRLRKKLGISNSDVNLVAFLSQV